MSGPSALDEPDAGLSEHARDLLEHNRYLTLGTVDAGGRPWTSPVYFAPAAPFRFLWISTTDARHSRHLEQRRDVSLVVFDSSAAPYHGRAVYAVGTARELGDAEVDEALRHYPGAPARGGAAMSRADVTGASPYRLYEARASRVWVLCPREPRQPCPRHHLAHDHRARVA